MCPLGAGLGVFAWCVGTVAPHDLENTRYIRFNVSFGSGRGAKFLLPHLQGLQSSDDVRDAGGGRIALGYHRGGLQRPVSILSFATVYVSDCGAGATWVVRKKGEVIEVHALTVAARYHQDALAEHRSMPDDADLLALIRRPPSASEEEEVVVVVPDEFDIAGKLTVHWLPQAADSRMPDAPPGAVLPLAIVF